MSTDDACFRHPQREAHIRCTRCDRFVCPDCRREAPVGFQCVDCVRTGHQDIRPARTVHGARLPRFAVSAGPLVTYALIGLNVLAYLGELLSPGIVDRFSNVGQLLADPQGRLYNYLPYPVEGLQPVGIAHGEWYRMITSAFLHSPPTEGAFGITHILFNMMWLWTLGRVLEQLLGRTRFLALYLISALGGSVLEYVISPDQNGIGASGAIYGLAGAAFVLSRRHPTASLGGPQLIIFFVIWMVVSAGYTSWQGHLGGLLAGGAVGCAYAFAPRDSTRTAVQAVGTALVLLALIGATLAETAQLTG